jgi:hypothetical protein
VRLSGPVVAAVLASAALAGALLSFWVAGDDASPAVPQTRPATATTAPTKFQRVLQTAVADLAQARRTGRERLARAAGSRAQSAEADALAGAYHRTALRLDKPAEAGGATVLLGALDRVTHAYQLLAEAARQSDRADYKVARLEVAAAERELPKAMSDALADAG